MYYYDFKGLKLSALGFGMMRLPKDADGKIDEALVQEMVDYALEHGVNYFDTAYPYMESLSEIVTGRCLSAHPRDSFYLATKYPGHQYASEYHPEDIFEEQLKKCGVDYFDFYLLHGINEASIKVYLDPKWGIIDYFLEQKRLGRIRHLGFSCHCQPETLEEFLNAAGDAMEFCQIQFNYLDWSLQSGERKLQILEKYKMPVWVMEPVRGGALVHLSEENMAKLAAAAPGLSPAQAAFRYQQRFPQIAVVLSGMSNMEQVKDNINTFAERRPLDDAQTAVLMEIAETLKNSVPCTKCRYCVDECPMGLNIPWLISLYNDAKYLPAMTISIQLEAESEDKWPGACVACGACARMCPQGIDIPGVMSDFASMIPNIPSWRKLCAEREEVARRLREGQA